MFINAELDICPAFGWQGGPNFNTRVVGTQAWIERRNANNILCRHNYSLPLANITDDAYLTMLKSVFMATRGQLHSFLVKDYSDFEAEQEPFCDGDGVTTVFQLQKTSVFGIASYVRTIIKPVAGLSIYLNGTLTAATVDLTTGLVTFGTAPGVGVVGTWTGEFRVPVRFNSDTLNTTIDNKTGAGTFLLNSSVDLIEVFGE